MVLGRLHLGEPRPLRLVGVVFLVSTLLGFLSFVYMALDEVVRGQPAEWGEPLVEELTGAYAGGILFFGVLALVRRVPLRRSTLARRVPLYVAGAAVFSAAHTSLNWLFRAAAFPLLGLGEYDYGSMPLRYVMESPKDLIVYGLMVGAIHAHDRVRASREREVETARLESELSRAELANLRLQLEPHFLFNALNAVSEKMYEDPAAADAMIGRLADLLRRTLRTVHAQEIPLREELDGLEVYVDVLRARFGERLRVVVDVEPGTEDARVPAMLLQPLTENAVRHGEIGRAGGGSITIRARRAVDGLTLEIADDGLGSPLEPELGTGLSVTADRLRLLYGEDHELDFGNRTGGGFAVTMRLPWRSA